MNSIENVSGGSGADTLVGSNAADSLDGGGGNDVIRGRGGSDTLIGAAGNDRLTGDGGNDTFQFRAGFGNDVVTDFRLGNAANHDTLNLRGLGFASVQDVFDHTDTGANAVIHVGAHSITLSGVTLAQLQLHAFDILV